MAQVQAGGGGPRRSTAPCSTALPYGAQPDGVPHSSKSEFVRREKRSPKPGGGERSRSGGGNGRDVARRRVACLGEAPTSPLPPAAAIPARPVAPRCVVSFQAQSELGLHGVPVSAFHFLTIVFFCLLSHVVVAQQTGLPERPNRRNRRRWRLRWCLPWKKHQ